MLVELVVGGEPSPWERLGFAISDGVCRIGSTVLRFDAGAPGGITRWVLAGPQAGDLDGLTTRWVEQEPAAEAAWTHPNGARQIDHVVVTTPDLERTQAAIEAVGVRCRRVRDATAGGSAVRQAFFRLGEVILEVVGPAEPAHSTRGQPAAFWGLVAVVEDLDACATSLGDLLGSARDAVQPGRRIATVRTAAGVQVALAFMST